MQQPKYLIAGRTASGKDFLKELLQKNYNWKFVNSYTTRKPRFDGEDTHQFITKEQASQFSGNEKIASTIIKGEEYFATKQQVEEADAYIIDPKGIETLLEKMPNTWFEIIYIQASDNNIRREKAINRASDKEKEAEIFEKRNEDENEQFELFEEQITHNTFSHNNHYGVHKIINTYDDDFMQNIAISLEMRKRFYKNTREILQTLIDNEMLPYEIINDVEYTKIYHNETNEPVNVRLDKFIQLLAEEKRDGIFSELMEMFLFSVKDLNISPTLAKPNEPKS